MTQAHLERIQLLSRRFNELQACASRWLARACDWPWRGYYLGATVAIAVGLAASASGAGLLEPDVTLATIFVLMGSAFVPIGVLDHQLLVNLVKECKVAESASAPDQVC